MKTPEVQRIAVFLGMELYYDRQVLKGVLAYAQNKPNWRLVRSLGLPVIHRAFIGRIECDGLILHSEPEDQVSARSLSPPAVVVSQNWKTPRVHMVVNDDLETGRLVARHFLSKGFVSFAYKGIRNKNFSQQWLDGFTDELARAGHKAVPSLLLTRSYKQERAAYFRIEKICRWLKELPLPVAIMACHDLDALEVVEACKILGLGIPHEVAIAGVDNDPVYTDLAEPSLTSVEQATYRIGFEAARRLDKLLEGVALSNSRLFLPPEGLRVRESTEVQAVSDPLVSRALAFIQDESSPTFSVKELAHRINVSRSLLDLRFRRILGRTPYSEIQRNQVDRARRLLGETEWPITEIALHCGFGDLAGFSAFFLKQTGMRPSTYRKLHSGMPDDPLL